MSRGLKLETGHLFESLVCKVVRKKNMRILILANAIVSSKSMSGGDKHFIEVGRRWKEVGHEVHALLPRVGYELCRKTGLDANFHVLPSSGEKGVILSYILRIIRSYRWNSSFTSNVVVYSSSDFLCDAMPAMMLRRKNPKNLWVANIYHIISPPIQRRGPFITNLISFFAQRLSFRLIKRHADLIFVLNNLVKSQLAKLGFSEDRIHVIGAGINLTQINQIPQARKMQYDACFLARLHPAKGIFDLIEIWKLVVLKKKNARLAVIYAGPKDLELALMKKIKEEDLRANVFMLPLTGDDALRVVKSSKIFVFPSHEEGWGIAVCEAMACGLPVIAYDLPIYKEIFTQGIITVPLNNINRFSEEVVGLLKDDEKRPTLGKQAEGQANKYDWDDVATRELLLMEKLKGMVYEH